MDTTSEDKGYGYTPPSQTAGKAVGAILSGIGKSMGSKGKPEIQQQSHPLPDVPDAQAPAPVRVAAAPMKSFKKGGMVHQTGVYKLHKGELVVPKHKVDAMTHDILSGKEKPKSKIKLVPVSKGHKPNGAHGRAAVKELGRTKTTGNFKRIEAARGKGAAIAAFQAKLAAHKAGK
ncbi:MAG: hypothetical protein WAU89_13445 [Candidatus Acidiferrales bacterium]